MTTITMIMIVMVTVMLMMLLTMMMLMMDMLYCFNVLPRRATRFLHDHVLIPARYLLASNVVEMSRMGRFGASGFARLGSALRTSTSCC